MGPFGLLLAEKGFLKVFPQDTEQNTLQTIGQNLGFQTTKHETGYTRLGQHVANDLHVRQLIRVRLLVHLDDANRVGTRVRNCRRAESQQGPTSQFGQLRILLGNGVRQEIVRKEPSVSSAEREKRHASEYVRAT